LRDFIPYPIRLIDDKVASSIAGGKVTHVVHDLVARGDVTGRRQHARV
jgi:hypothetical protein